MFSALKYTLRFSDHVRSVTHAHFAFRHPKPEIDTELLANDVSAFRVYYREIFIELFNSHKCSPEQVYLSSLQDLIAPILASYGIKQSIVRMKPRTNTWSASSRFEKAAKSLSFESYHYKERIKQFGNATALLISDTERQCKFRRSTGYIIASYAAANRRLLKYRNYIVHGSADGFDEFHDLRSWELGGMFHHSDLWADYNTEFWAAQNEWRGLANVLIKSMEESVAKIQLLNEDLLASQSISFG